jgi:hypothetical protein
MANAKKRKARKARRAVPRSERVKATPETLAKLRPHPLELLLKRGRDDGGIDADQLQCAEEITDAYAAVTQGLGIASPNLERVSYSPRHDEAMSNRAERLSMVWFAWASELMQRRQVKPAIVVELISGERALAPAAVSALTWALDLWAKVRHDLSRPQREVSTICPKRA